MPAMSSRPVRLAVIATAAGAFSALFGVGGGTIIVPLLILWFGYGQREATGTSLAAIVPIALFAVVAQGLYGNVDLVKGLLIGLPAMAGVLAGTALQQRISTRAVAAVFVTLLVISAGLLVF
jgi:uncharacterized membrane protein YfcA